MFIPLPGRLLHETVDGSDGERVLTLFYNEKEITFDEPRLLPFGERLLKETRFVAEQALTWSADGYSWETVKELCEALLSEGILELEDLSSPSAPAPVDRGEYVVGSGSVAAARAWTAESCLALSTEIFGTPVEVGNLESLIRCVRIAHPALDVGGRQVGERNVFPSALQLDLPTKVRGCPYRGSRFEHELPMNVAGLDPVVKCWRGVLHDVRALKREFFRRRPAARDGLTVVDLYVLGTIALCIPAFLMLRSEDPVENGRLPLEASAFFRVMDGTRMTPRDMLLTVHPSFGPDVVPSAEKFFHYADRELLLIADRGVCAGPPQMIETFLELVLAVDAEAEPLAPTPASLIGDLKTAANYGIVACEVETIADQFWVRQRAIVDRLVAHLADQAKKHPIEQALLTRFEDSFLPGAASYLFIQPGASIEGVYRNFSRIIQQCHEMRGRPGRPSIPPFDDGVDVGDAEVVAVHAVLRRELPELGASTTLELALAIVRLRRVEEQTFPRMAERQAEVNGILGRPQPSRALNELDIATAWPLVSLRAALSEEVGITLGPRTSPSLSIAARSVVA